MVMEKLAKMHPRPSEVRLELYGLTVSGFGLLVAFKMIVKESAKLRPRPSVVRLELYGVAVSRFGFL